MMAHSRLLVLPGRRLDERLVAYRALSDGGLFNGIEVDHSRGVVLGSLLILQTRFLQSWLLRSILLLSLTQLLRARVNYLRVCLRGCILRAQIVVLA